MQQTGESGRNSDRDAPRTASPAAGQGAQAPVEDPIAVLTRWEQSGAHWRVLHRDDQSLTIGLLTCHGDEIAERLTSQSPQLRQWVGQRASSLD